MGICRRDFGRLMLGGLATSAFGISNRPKLLVIVVLEQFRPDYVETSRSQLAPGGFRKLLEKGAVYYNCLNRSSTFSASALATLATAAWPAEHGIVADRWYDRSSGRAIAASDEELLGSTFLSEIAADSRARVTVVGSNREHAALFAAGVPVRDEPHLYWMDDNGRFTSNGEEADWLASFQSPNSAESVHNTKWVAVGARPDAPPLRTLTWAPDRPADFLSLYRSSPFAQAAVFDLASELIGRNRLGQTNTFDVLCILPSAMEQLGYETGARSPLMQQMALQLDRRLEILFAQLAKTPGEAGYAFALTAAHGAPVEPASEARIRMAVHGEQLAQAIQKAVAEYPARVARYVYPFLYLNVDLTHELEPIRLAVAREREPIRVAAGRAALSHPGVAGFYTAGGTCSVHNEWQRRFANSFHPVRSGDLMLSYRPGYIESTGLDRGISYGSLYDYDARVPMYFYGPQFRPGVYEQTVEAIDFAPTLARVAGVAPPSVSMGRVLGEALVE